MRLLCLTQIRRPEFPARGNEVVKTIKNNYNLDLIIIIDKFCIALFSDVHKLTALVVFFFCLSGDEQIVHLAGDDNDGINGQIDSGHLFTICGQRFRKALVKVDNFWDVVDGCKAMKNNAKDGKHK